MSENPQNQGQGGSMARFAIYGNYLYVLDHSNLNVYDISNGSTFEKIKTVEISWGDMETIFANGAHIYMGSTNAMYIYSIEDPANPEFQFQYQHMTACDPVVVQGDLAFVTMRSGTACNVGTNALEILDISNPLSPILLATHPMESPHGLGVYDDLIFLCEGEFGLKVFSFQENGAISQLGHLTTFHAYDVIVRPGHAIVTGDDGIFQFSFNTGTDLELLSTIPVNRTEP